MWDLSIREIQTQLKINNWQNYGSNVGLLTPVLKLFPSVTLRCVVNCCSHLSDEMQD